MGKSIVKFRYIFLIIFIVLLVIACVFLPGMIKKVNYDLTSYLPEGYATYDGYQFLSKNFGIHGDIEIGVEATYDDVKKIADEISTKKGVTSATWAEILSFLLDSGIYDKNNPTDLANYEKLRAVLTTAPDVSSPDFDPTKKYTWAILMSLEYPPSSQEAIALFGEVKKICAKYVGDGNFSMSGMTEQANALFETVFDEIGIYCLIAAIVVLFILALTTNSLMEPIILLITMAVSILINLGTNIIFPSTSIITFACSAILQLGLSMDYAIFLLHQYRHELTKTLDPKVALANALPKSAKAVIASALTTVGGFLALLCMKFGVGSDLGLVLAKGIACSLLTVLFLQPCLMLMLDKARVKTQHKCVDIHFKAPIKRAIKYRWPVAIVLVLLLVPMFLVSNSLKYTYVKFLPESTDTSAKYKMAQELGNQVIVAVPYLYKIPDSGKFYDNTPLIKENYAFVAELEKLKASGEVSFSLGLFNMLPQSTALDAKMMIDSITATDLGNMNGMKPMLFRIINSHTNSDGKVKIMDLLEELLPFVSNGVKDTNGAYLDGGMFAMSDITKIEGAEIIAGYLSANENGFYTIYTLGINPAYDMESEESIAILAKINKIASDIFGVYKYTDNDGNVTGRTFETHAVIYMTGNTQAAADFKAITPTDFMLVTIVSIAIILIILMLTLGGMKFPALLVVLIEFSIWINLALQYVFSGGVVNFMSYLIITAVQLGATVDYAILVATRYKELRGRLEPKHAAYQATAMSAMTILTSATIMAGACFSVFFVSSNLVIKEMTFLMARGALISAALVIFVLPSLLTVADKCKGHELVLPRTPLLRPWKPVPMSVRASWKADRVKKAQEAKAEKAARLKETNANSADNAYKVDNANSADNAHKADIDKADNAYKADIGEVDIDQVDNDEFDIDDADIQKIINEVKADESKNRKE